jgi:hypothetical protein
MHATPPFNVGQFFDLTVSKKERYKLQDFDTSTGNIQGVSLQVGNDYDLPT